MEVGMGDCEALPTGARIALPLGDREVLPKGDCAALPLGDREALPKGDRFPRWTFHVQ
ncbi:hypothetical protein [Cylindrospermopsis raciborskii]|uniref:hypothetical protein n=2 Tax=Cylindrospermopsis raciborskii TaxID=77022 RepID=UPI0015E0F7D3|nr:hypothetical protein [Cylindrospermopsis raciborskii]